jgi:endonuclease/exonuclease/phosphatase family metal-dependent hydrolase
MAALVSLVSLTFGLGIPSAAEESASRIVIDGFFDDWEEIPVRVRDPIDPAAVLCDFRELRATSDAGAVFVYGRLQHRMLLKISGGRVRVLIDTDGDPETGWSEHGMEGVDASAQGHPGDSAEVDAERPVGLRFRRPDAGPSRDAAYDSLNRVGIMKAPAFESDRFEIRLPRGLAAPELAAPLLSGSVARLKLIAMLPDGTIVDDIGPFSLELEAFDPTERVEQELDPLARRPGTRLRVAEWNVSHRSLADRKTEIAKVLSALRPDLVLLNEVSDTFSSEDVGRILEQAGIVKASTPGQVIYGRSGGDERAVIAGRFPLRELPGLSDLPYPTFDPRQVPALKDQAPVFMAQLEKGIQSAGAIATVGDRRLLLTSLGLKSGGYRTFSVEDHIRVIQARTIASAIAAINSAENIDAVVVGGDFNLVVTERPLFVLARETETGDSPLTILNALQLDGRSNATWSNPKLSFSAGRLDFVMYSAPALELDRSFVFDSRDLSPEWLEHHSLTRDVSDRASDHFPTVADFSW